MENSIPTDKKVEIAKALIERAIWISDNTQHDVFVDWAPHVNHIGVAICRGGWKTNHRSTSVTVGFDANDDTEGDYEAVNAILDKLEGK
jgi:hypothetical protein